MVDTQGFNTLAELGERTAGRNPEWYWQNEARSGLAASFSGAPDESEGVSVIDAIVTMFCVHLREQTKFHGARVRIATLDATAAVTYTLTIGTLAHVVTLAGGETEDEILTDLGALVDSGVDLTTLGGATIAHADANPDTITRSAGSWITDGVEVGDRVTSVTAGGANDGTTFTVAGVTATVLTLVDSDAVVAEAASAVTSFVVRKPITTSLEDRDQDGVIDTLVINRANVNDQVDDDATTFTTAVAATGTGVMEFDEDADSCDLQVWLQPDALNDVSASNVLGPAKSLTSYVDMVYVKSNNGTFTGLDWGGLVERFETSGFKRMYVEPQNVTSPTTGATVTMRVLIGPGGVE